MRKEEFEKSMLELGATKCNGGLHLYVEANDGCSITYWYNEEKGFYVEVDMYERREEKYFDILYLHYKDLIISCGVSLYGEMIYKLGQENKQSEIRKVLGV